MASSSSVKVGCLSNLILQSSLECDFSLPDQTTKSTAKAASSLHMKAPGPNVKHSSFECTLQSVILWVILLGHPSCTWLLQLVQPMNVCKLIHSTALAYSTLIVATRRSAMPTYLWTSVVCQLVDLRHNQTITSALATLLDHANISSFSSAFIVRLPRQPRTNKGIFVQGTHRFLDDTKCKPDAMSLLNCYVAP